MGQSESTVGLTSEEELVKQLEAHKEDNYSSYWTGASRVKLFDLESKFFKQCTTLPFRQRVCGGLGTIDIDPDNPENKNKPVLVLVHGYGLCNAMWALCVDTLHLHFRLHLVELHGHGRSDRLTFPDNLSADHAEQLMASYLELWRKESGLEEQFFLAGHSLGGMVCWRYAAQYGERLRHLLLVSPVGLPGAPTDLEERLKNAPALYRFVIGKWKSGTSPMDLIRSLGPFGMSLMRRMMRRRMSFYPETSAAHTLDVDLLTELMHQSWTLPRSGEQAMNAMLHPGAYAKLPLMPRVIANQGRPYVPDPSLPFSLIYGARNLDWMKSEFGHSMSALLLAREGSVYGNVVEVEKAGHMVAWDNPKGFVEALITECVDAKTLVLM